MRRLSPALMLMIIFAGIGLILCGYDPPANADPPAETTAQDLYLNVLPEILAQEVEPPAPLEFVKVEPIKAPEQPAAIEPEPEIALPEIVLPEAPARVDVTSYAYQVRARGHLLRNGRYVVADPPPECTAISIGEGRFLTAKHLVDGLAGAIEVDVRVNGKWTTNVPFQRAADRDAITIKTELDVPGVEVRAPEYREEVVAYGLSSRVPLDGLYCGIMAQDKPESLVALNPDEVGVIPGDSGGGVFGRDGKLIGLIQGYGAERKVVWTILVADLPLEAPLAAAPKAAPSQSPPAAQARSGCPSGVCPAPRSTFGNLRSYGPRRGIGRR